MKTYGGANLGEASVGVSEDRVFPAACNLYSFPSSHITTSTTKDLMYNEHHLQHSLSNVMDYSACHSVKDAFQVNSFPFSTVAEHDEFLCLRETCDTAPKTCRSVVGNKQTECLNSCKSGKSSNVSCLPTECLSSACDSNDEDFLKIVNYANSRNGDRSLSLMFTHIEQSNIIENSEFTNNVTSSIMQTGKLANHIPYAWSSIKTDNFENITDDEDEDIAARCYHHDEGSLSVAEQPIGCSVSTQIFPGFRRLGSHSFLWTSSSFTNSPVCVVKPRICDRVNCQSFLATTGFCCVSSLGLTDAGNIGSRGTFSHHIQCGLVQSGQSKQQDAVMFPASQHCANNFSNIDTGCRDKWCACHTAVCCFTSVAPCFEPITDSEDEMDCAEKHSCLSLMPTETNMPIPACTSPFDCTLSCGPSILLTGGTLTCSTTFTGGSNVINGVRDTPIANDLLGLRCYSSSSAISSSVSTFLHISSACVSSTSYGTGESVGAHLNSVKPAIFAVVSLCHSCCSMSSCDIDSPADSPEGAKTTRTGMKGHSTPPHTAMAKRCADKSVLHACGDKYIDAGNILLHRGGCSVNGEICCILRPLFAPPTRQDVEISALSVGLSAHCVIPAFCSQPADLPDHPR